MPRAMEIVTPFDTDVLLFHGMHAREDLSRLSDYRVSLLSHPDHGDIEIDKILGQNVTIKLALRDEGTRYFNGYVTRFSHVGKHGRYNRFIASVQPWTWFMTRTADCRIFQDMTVPDIVKAVFADHSTADVKFELTSSYRKWTYCVQYRETDFNFISRLLEHEGIFYYFRHTQGHHTLVLSDANTKLKAEPGYDIIKFFAPEQFVRPEVEYISRWDFSREVQPGLYVHTDYDLVRPSVNLRTQKTLPRSYTPSDYEVFDYPGFYVQKPDGDHYAGVRIDEFGTQFETAQSTTNARGLKVGSLFTLEGYRRPDQNREHVVISATYDLQFSEYEAMPDEGPPSYQCHFVSMSSEHQFRPKRATPKPFVQGPQTAVVVGPGGDEIYTDDYGRVKVKFHWDRAPKKDQTSSCWIRVSHPWAGKGWGAIATPRIGQEVIVDFLEGDPDQPIITGRVYNAEQMPPYALPANKTQTGILTRSSLGGSAANANELRFEDKKGSEQLFIHAEKNQDIEVENDETHWVGHDRKKTIDNDETTLVKHDRTETVDNDETITIHHDRTEVVDNDETITIRNNRKEFVGANETITITDNRTKAVNGSESVTVALQRTHNVGVNETISVGGGQEVSVGGLQAITVGGVQTTTVGVSQSISVNGNRSVRADKNLSTTVTKEETRTVGDGRETKVGKDDSLEVGKKLTIVAGDSVMLKTGEASITMKKNGDIVIKGKNITLEGSGKINVKASSDVVMKGSNIKGN